MKHVGENVVRIEAEALRRLADRIAGPMAQAFDRAVDLMYAGRGRVVVTGMGKSGIVARKVAATLNSTGTPALYMHPVEAVHGDLGMVFAGDVGLSLSASGETEEILRLLATIKRLQGPLISVTCDEIYNSSHGLKPDSKKSSSGTLRRAQGKLDKLKACRFLNPRARAPALRRQALPCRRQRMWRSTALSPKKRAHWGSRRRRLR